MFLTISKFLSNRKCCNSLATHIQASGHENIESITFSRIQLISQKISNSESEVRNVCEVDFVGTANLNCNSFNTIVLLHSHDLKWFRLLFSKEAAFIPSI